MAAPEWDIEPGTIGEAVAWFDEAENHLTEGADMVDYIAKRWVFIMDQIAEKQGVPPGWLAYMVSTLAAEDILHGEST